MEVFFPVSEEERDALLARDFRHAELSGLERIAWDYHAPAREAAI